MIRLASDRDALGGVVDAEHVPVRRHRRQALDGASTTAPDVEDVERRPNRNVAQSPRGHPAVAFVHALEHGTAGLTGWLSALTCRARHQDAADRCSANRTRDEAKNRHRLVFANRWLIHEAISSRT